MRDNKNTIRVEGYNNIVNLMAHNEQKDKKTTMITPAIPSSGEVASSAPSDLATKYSTLYEKPYIIPFSNVGPQIPSREVGMAVGTGVPDIRPLKTSPPPLRNEPSQTERTAYNQLKSLLDDIDVPTGIQDFTKSYEKTPTPDTTTPMKGIPEAEPFSPDPLYPAQTMEEYQQSLIKSSNTLVDNKKKNKVEVYDENNVFLGTLDMRRPENKKLFFGYFGYEWKPRKTSVKKQKTD
jgi:hypothetical protein